MNGQTHLDGNGGQLAGRYPGSFFCRARREQESARVREGVEWQAHTTFGHSETIAYADGVSTSRGRAATLHATVLCCALSHTHHFCALLGLLVVLGPLGLVGSGLLAFLSCFGGCLLCRCGLKSITRARPTSGTGGQSVHRECATVGTTGKQKGWASK